RHPRPERSVPTAAANAMVPSCSAARSASTTSPRHCWHRDGSTSAKRCAATILHARPRTSCANSPAAGSPTINSAAVYRCPSKWRRSCHHARVGICVVLCHCRGLHRSRVLSDRVWPRRIFQGMAMNRPLARPLVPEDVRRTNPSLARAASAHLRSFITGQTPTNAEKAMYGEADLATPAILRAATGTAKTQQTGWAADLAPTAVLATIQDAASVSAAASIIARSLSLDLGALAQLNVPSRPLTPSDAAKFLAEGAPIPVRQFNFAASTLHPFALKTITTYSRELSESSGIEAVCRQTLAESFGLGLDAVMLSATAGTSSQPAGLFQSPPITPTAGGGAAAMVADIKLLFTALAQNGAGANVVIVAALPQAASLKAQLSPKFDWPIFASTAMAIASVGAVDVTSFVSGFTSEVEFDVSKATALHMDTAPTDIGSGG